MALVGGLEGAKSMGAGATTTMSERLLSYSIGGDRHLHFEMLSIYSIDGL